MSVNTRYESVGLVQYLEGKIDSNWRNIPRSKAYLECMHYFNEQDERTRNVLLSVHEADQNMIMQGLATKLYQHIIGKVDQIDFGTIPLSKGNIEQVEHYDQLMDCINVLGQILQNYKQPTDELDIITIAEANIKDRTDLFRKAYRLNVEMPIIAYNTMALSVFSAVSLMIAAHIEFIKTGDNSGYEIAFNKASKIRTKDKLLFQTLRDFNIMCSKGDFDKIMNYAITTNTQSKNESMIIQDWSYIGESPLVVANPKVLISYAKEIVQRLYPEMLKCLMRYPSMQRYFSIFLFDPLDRDNKEVLQKYGNIRFADFKTEDKIWEDPTFKSFLTDLDLVIRNSGIGELAKDDYLETYSGSLYINLNPNMFAKYLKELQKSVPVVEGYVIEETNLQPITEGILQNIAQALFYPGAALIKAVGAGATTIGSWLAGHPIVAGIGAVIIGIILVIKLIRNAIFYFYKLRVRMTDWADMQASLLYMNALNIQNDLTRDEKARKELSTKYKNLSTFINKLADKIRIADTAAENNVSKELAKLDSAKLSIDDLPPGLVPTAQSSLF